MYTVEFLTHTVGMKIVSSVIRPTLQICSHPLNYSQI